MNPLKKRFVASILNHPILIVTFTLLLTLVAILFIPKVKLDNSVEVFFDKKSESYKLFQSWKEQFGSDDVVILSFSDADIFTKENLEFISRLTKQLESLKYVDKVVSLTNVNNIIGYEDYFAVKPLVEKIPTEEKELKALKKEALDNPLYIKNIISQDAKTTGVLIQLKDIASEEDSDYKKEAFLAIESILKREFKGKKYYVSGLVTIEHFLTFYMQRDLKTFLPLIFFIILIVLVFILRDIKGIMLCISVVLITLCWTIAFLYLCGFSINNVTTVIPPLVIAISLADSIHIIDEYSQKKRKNGKGYPIEHTAEELFRPCLLTSLTTLVGFLSLTVSKIPAIRELGLIAGGGVVFAFIVTFTFLPAMMKITDLASFSHRKNQREIFEKMLRTVGKFIEKYKYFIILVSSGLIILSLWGLQKIKVETSILEYFRKDAPVYLSTRYIERNLSGVHFLNISLKSKEENFFRAPEILKNIEDLQHYLDKLPEVDKTISVVDYIKEINKSFHKEDPTFYKIPSSKKELSQYLLLYGASDLEDFVDLSWTWTTVRVRLGEHSTSRLRTTIAKIREYLEKNFPENIESKILGNTVLEVESNEAVTRGQIQSLLLAITIIFGMMFVVFKSISVGVVSLVPNILPILINFGIMGWLGIRLDSATTMISAIGIGIIVDDTIHFLHRFGGAVKDKGDYVEAMRVTLTTKGRPITFTSLILFFGFGVVVFSQFVPTYYFALLSALLMVNALWADILVLPSILLFFKPKFK